jgi:WD40 repeat protein
MRLVVGRPGAGKSTLLALVAGGTEPSLHGNLPVAGVPELRSLAAQGGDVIVADAAYRSVAEVADILMAQAMPGRTLPDRQFGAGVIDAVACRPAGTMVVVDGVDEANDPEAVIRQLLLPLSLARRATGGPLCGLLVAARRIAPCQALLERASQLPDATVDLDGRPDDLDAMVFDRAMDLLVASRHFGGASSETRIELASAIQQRLMARDRAMAWGPLAMAGAAVGVAVSRARAGPTDLGGLVATLASLPDSLPDVFEYEVRTLDDPLVRAVFVALAFARGGGMPVDVLRAAMQPFASHRPGLKTLTEILALLPFYVRHRDIDGRRTLALVHPTLAAHLRSRPYGADRPTAPPAARREYEGLVLGALVDAMVARSRTGRPDRYLRRHAFDHAAAADRVDERLQDLNLLVHCRPERVAAHSWLVHTPRASRIGAVYRAVAERHPGLEPRARRAALALEAVRVGWTALASGLNRLDPSGWEPAWSQLAGQLTAQRRLSMPSRVRMIAVEQLAHGPVLVVADRNGDLGVWDLDRATLTSTLSGTSPGTPMATTIVDDRLAVATLRNSTTVLVRDAQTGVELWSTTVPAADIRSLAARHPLIAAGTSDGRLLVWDTTGAVRPRQFRLRRGRWIGSVALDHQGDRSVVLAAASPGGVEGWDLRTGERVRAGPGSEAEIVAMGCGDLRGTPTVVTADAAGVIRTVGLFSGEPEQVVGGGVGLTSLCLVDTGGEMLACAGFRDGRIQIWDIATRRPIWNSEAHGGEVVAVAPARVGNRSALVTADARALLVWHLPVPHVPDAPDLVVAGPVALPADRGRRADARAVFVSGPDRMVRAWDPATGEIVYSLECQWRIRALACAALTTDDEPDGSLALLAVTETGELLSWRQPWSGIEPVRVSAAARLTAIAAGTWSGGPVALLGDADGRLIVRAFAGDARGLVVRTGLSAIRTLTCVDAGGMSSVVAADDSGAIAVVDLTDARVRTDRPATAAGRALASIAVGGNRYVATADSAGWIRLWNPVTATTVSAWRGHSGPITTLTAIPADGAPVLVSGGSDRVLRTWRPGVHGCFDELPLPDAPSSAVAFDSGLIVAHGHQISALRWRMSESERS